MLKWTLVLYVCLRLLLAAPAAAVQLRPEAQNWTGFVGSLGIQFSDSIATGSLVFQLFEPDARGYARFSLLSIPEGSTINSVRLLTWVSNHDLVGDPLTCSLPAEIRRVDLDPLSSTAAQIHAAARNGNLYYEWVQARTGPTFCPESFVLLDVNLGAQAVADVEAALPAGYFTVGLLSQVVCHPDGDHLDFIGYSEVVNGDGIDCGTVPFPGTRITLDVDYTPPDPGCDLTQVEPIVDLRALKTPDRAGVALSWSFDPEAEAHNIWYVDAKQLIPAARLGGSGEAPTGCSPAPGNTCVHPDAIDPAVYGDRLYYQVRGVCQGDEAAE